MVDGISVTPAKQAEVRFSRELIDKIEKEAGSEGDKLNGQIDTKKEARIAQRYHRQWVESQEKDARNARGTYNSFWDRSSDPGLDETDFSTGSGSGSAVDTTDRGSFIGNLLKGLYEHTTGNQYPGKQGSSDAMMAAMMAQNPMMAIIFMLMQQIQKLNDKIDALGKGEQKTGGDDDDDGGEYDGPVITPYDPAPTPTAAPADPAPTVPTAAPDPTAEPAAPDQTPTAAPSAAPTGSAGNGNQTTYTVQQGDTLSAIAEKNKTTVDALLKLNPDITDINKIDVDQVIKLPTATE